MNHRTSRDTGNRSLVLKLAVVTVAMFGFGFLMVPLYNVFCDVLGIDSRPDNTAAAGAPVTADDDRVITMEFMAAVNEYAPWEFKPNTVSIKVHPGKLYDTSYFARNLTDQKLVGQAIASVAPSEAAQYLHKTQCFCFTSQKFEPEESRNMGVRFFIDKDIPEYIDRLTLSYTFFVKHQAASDNSGTTH